MVVLKKERDGKDAKVGSTTSNRHGRWAIRKAHVHGHYYAMVKSKTVVKVSGAIIICKSDKSPTVRV